MCIFFRLIVYTIVKMQTQSKSERFHEIQKKKKSPLHMKHNNRTAAILFASEVPDTRTLGAQTMYFQRYGLALYQVLKGRKGRFFSKIKDISSVKISLPQYLQDCFLPFKLCYSRSKNHGINAIYVQNVVLFFVLKIQKMHEIRRL